VSSSRQNQLQSPLLRLPAELRNQVYNYALSDWNIRIFYQEYSMKPVKHMSAICRPTYNTGSWIPTNKAILSLPSVCRQLNMETKLLPFTLNNEFGLETTRCLEKFIERLGHERRSLIANVRLEVSDQTTGIRRDAIAWLRSVAPGRLREFPNLAYVTLEVETTSPRGWAILSGTMARSLNSGKEKSGRKAIQVKLVCIRMRS